MKTIQIVTNSDRCHVSINGTPEFTFVYFSYSDKSEEAKMYHAINDAKVQAFNILSNYQKEGVKAFINTDISRK